MIKTSNQRGSEAGFGFARALSCVTSRSHLQTDPVDILQRHTLILR